MTEINLTPGQHKYYGAIVEKSSYLKGQIISIFRDAKQYHYNLDKILSERQERVFNSPKFKKLPATYRGAIVGYFEGALDLFFSQNMEWVLYYDGVYIGNSKRENLATDQMYKNVNFDNNKVKGYHVYIGTEYRYN